MPKRSKGPTIEDLRKVIRLSFKRWAHLKRKGSNDPGYADGVNMGLVRNHIIYDQICLRELCKTEKVRPCPPEARLKLPPIVSIDYCAPGSKAGPCIERRKK